MRNDKRIKAVIFDLDDTLIDWSKQSVTWQEYNDPKLTKLHAYLVNDGQPLSEPSKFVAAVHARIRYVWEEAKKTFAGARLVDALALAIDDCGGNSAVVDMNELLIAYNWTAFPGVRPFDDTHDVLSQIKHQGYKIGLITNAFQPMWFRDVELESHDLIKYLDARITSGDTRFMKPHPAIYWRMLGLLDLMPEDAIFVGDRPEHDVAGAQGVGMLGVLMKPPHLDRDLFGVEPDYTIRTLTELMPILAELD